MRKFGNGTSETTLNDKAGRVTVKAQKSDRGELQWAEGYLYGEDGQAQQDEFMKVLMDGVVRPEEIKKIIISKNNVQKNCNK